jgi:hypothetical protein
MYASLIYGVTAACGRYCLSPPTARVGCRLSRLRSYDKRADRNWQPIVVR